jgi:drug/metabolite transporter superfamily protein YnfA
MLDALTSSTAGSFFFLLLAASLEVLGDSFFQSGLHRTTGSARILPVIAGTVSLILYGAMVNAPRWNFGKLLGVYGALFFLVAQIVAWVRFHEIPAPRMIWGGAFFFIGGAILGLGRAS